MEIKNSRMYISELLKDSEDIKIFLEEAVKEYTPSGLIQSLNTDVHARSITQLAIRRSSFPVKDFISRLIIKKILRGSNLKKQKNRVSKLTHKIANIRNDYLHKIIA